MNKTIDKNQVKENMRGFLSEIATDVEKEEILFQLLGELYGFDKQTKVTNVVFETANHQLFSEKLKGNRPITEKVKKRIKNSIKRHGQIAPIIVNENGEILDGQHRLSAIIDLSKEKGEAIPVRVVCQPGYTLEQARVMNICQSKWKLYDYVASFADYSDDYKRLVQVIEDFKYSLSSKCILAVATGSYGNNSNGNGSKMIKNGLFTMSQEQEKKIRKCLKDLSELVFIARKSNLFKCVRYEDKFLNAVSYLMMDYGFSSRRFGKAFASYRGEIESNNFNECIRSAFKVYHSVPGKRKNCLCDTVIKDYAVLRASTAKKLKLATV